MSFLDNSGDIILDAVLTDLGRKKMADGNFLIDNFALGDDEINYSQYNKSHPSGSAYYDLEILQTPILQAFTQINAGINYGLLTMSDTQILYMPSLVPNEKQAPMQGRYSGIYYVAVNTDTASALKDEGLTDKQIQNVVTTTNPSIYIESGIDTTELSNTQANQSTYIIGKNLSNSKYTLSVDSRIVGSVMGPSATNVGYSLSSDGQTYTVAEALATITGNSNDGSLKNYSQYSIRGITSQVFQTSAGQAATAFTAISGPTDSITYFKVNVMEELKTTGTAPQLYSTLGRTGVAGSTIFAAASTSYTYDYIDTMAYISGDASGAQVGVSLRIIRRAS